MPRRKAICVFTIIAVSPIVLASCVSSKFSNWRDVPVSEVTLAEPFVAQKKLTEQIGKLRTTPGSKQKLAAALAELSLVHDEISPFELDKDCGRLYEQTAAEAKEAISLLDPDDVSSRAYFLSRRALSQVVNRRRGHGEKIIEPLLSGPWSDLDKAQIYNDLAECGESNCAQVYVEKALVLRIKAAGPNSLEVAESLITAANLVCDSGDKDTTLWIKIKKDLALNEAGKGALGINDRVDICRRRAADIRQSVLGDMSLELADALSCLGEQDQLRAINIYERQLGPDNGAVKWAYSSLANRISNPLRKAEYQRKAGIASALQEAGADPFKTAYVCLKKSSNSTKLDDQKDVLAKTFRSFGFEPPKLKGPVLQNGNICHQFSGQDLGISDLDVLYASLSVGDSVATLIGDKSNKEVLRQHLPSYGFLQTSFSVINNRLLRYHQLGPGDNNYQQIEYRWNGQKFRAVAASVGGGDRALLQDAFDDAVSGVGYHGLCGYHKVDSALIRNALTRADAASEVLYRGGHPRAAAARLRTMFELTSDLVEQAVTGEAVHFQSDDKVDDLHKWESAWTCKSPLCEIDLSANEWRPHLRHYARYLEACGEDSRARQIFNDF